jgi:hypothetical protein
MGVQVRMMRHFRKSLITLLAQFELGFSERLPKATGFGQQPAEFFLGLATSVPQASCQLSWQT